MSAGEEVVLFCAHFGGIRCVCGVYVRMVPVCDCNLVWIGRYSWVCLLLGSGLKWIGFDRLDWTGLDWIGLVWFGWDFRFVDFSGSFKDRLSEEEGVHIAFNSIVLDCLPALRRVKGSGIKLGGGYNAYKARKKECPYWLCTGSSFISILTSGTLLSARKLLKQRREREEMKEGRKTIKEFRVSQ